MGKSYGKVLLQLLLAGVVATGSAQVITYDFSGHLEADRPDPATDPQHGLPFTARLTYSLDPSDYSDDWQPAPHFGEYKTQFPLTSLELRYEGRNYDSNPELLTSLEIFNDTGLFYDQGIPAVTGDQFGIWHYAVVTSFAEFPEFTRDGQTFPAESFRYETPYLLKFLATDLTGGDFSSDALRTQVDLTQFDDLRIEIRPVIPLASIFPTAPTVFDLFPLIAHIEQFRVVPEPSSLTLAACAAFLVGRRRR